jgi:hypothetical protein
MRLRMPVQCGSVMNMRNVDPQAETATTSTCKHCGKGIRRNVAGIWGARKRLDPHPWWCGENAAAEKTHAPTIELPAGEHCSCGSDDWERRPGHACTVVCCAVCGYVADIDVVAS